MSIAFAIRAENPSGDIGPCDHIDCKNRATWKVLVDIANGIRTFVYLCDEHETLIPDEAVA